MTDGVVDGLREAAVLDNVRWVEAVARASGVGGRTVHGVWAARGATPPGYPEVVTTGPATAAADVVAALPPGVPGRSVKDSWADVDLTDAGLQVLFEAAWIAHRSVSARARDLTGDRSSGGWYLVAAGQVRAWRRARELAGAPDAPALLHGAPGVVLLGRGDPSAPDAWAVATVRTDLRVVGVSNVGVGDEAAAGASGVAAAGPRGARRGGAAGQASGTGVWPGLLGALAPLAPGLPVVGYEAGEALAEALDAGFEPLGPLRVWLEGP